MAVLATIASKKACGGNDVKTGTLGCQIEFGTPLHAIGMKKGFKIPSNQDFNLAYINEQIQKGIFIPLISASSFEDLSGEDTVSTNSAGVERLNLRGLPKYRLVFEEGHEFYRELSKITSFKGLDFIVGDELGQWRMALNNDGTYGGFDTGQVIAQLTTTKAQGGDPEAKGVTMQFLNRTQWDREYDIFIPENLGFQPEDIMGVNNIVLSFTAEPADTNTTITFQAVLDADKTTFVTGLQLADFRAFKGVNPLVITQLTEADNVYTATVAALVAADELKLETYSASASSRTVLSNGILYCSPTLEAIVIN